MRASFVSARIAGACAAVLVLCTGVAATEAVDSAAIGNGRLARKQLNIDGSSIGPLQPKVVVGPDAQGGLSRERRELTGQRLAVTRGSGDYLLGQAAETGARMMRRGLSEVGGALMREMTGAEVEHRHHPRHWTAGLDSSHDSLTSLSDKEEVSDKEKNSGVADSDKASVPRDTAPAQQEPALASPANSSSSASSASASASLFSLSASPTETENEEDDAENAVDSESSDDAENSVDSDSSDSASSQSSPPEDSQDSSDDTAERSVEANTGLIGGTWLILVRKPDEFQTDAFVNYALKFSLAQFLNISKDAVNIDLSAVGATVWGEDGTKRAMIKTRFCAIYPEDEAGRNSTAQVEFLTHMSPESVSNRVQEVLDYLQANFTSEVTFVGSMHGCENDLTA